MKSREIITGSLKYMDSHQCGIWELEDVSILTSYAKGLFLKPQKLKSWKSNFTMVTRLFRNLGPAISAKKSRSWVLVDSQ